MRALADDELPITAESCAADQRWMVVVGMAAVSCTRKTVAQLCLCRLFPGSNQPLPAALELYMSIVPPSNCRP